MIGWLVSRPWLIFCQMLLSRWTVFVQCFDGDACGGDNCCAGVVVLLVVVIVVVVMLMVVVWKLVFLLVVTV